MDQSSQVKVLESQLRECFGRATWTHKTHEKCADLLNSRLDSIKLSQIIMAAVATSGILLSVFGESKPIGIASALVAFCLTILNTYMKQYDLGGLAQKHGDSAALIWDIRERYLSLLTDIKAEIVDISGIQQQRDRLQSELFGIYKGSPRTISKPYKEATKALHIDEELTFSDSEIDNLLPKAMRSENSL